MAGGLFMTIIAGIIRLAAFEPDRDDIERRMVVDAAGLVVDDCAFDFDIRV